MTEEDYMPEFVEDQMVVQLGKILDSVGNAIPRDWVKTDAGVVIDCISPNVAARMRDALFNVPAHSRLEITRMMQSSDGFKEIMRAVA